MKKILLIITAGLVIAMAGGPARVQVDAQDSTSTALLACYGQVNPSFFVDMLRGPSYQLYGVKRTIPSGQELRILAADETGEWVQAYLPRVDIIGWMLLENMFVYGACSDLPVLSDEADFEPEPPPADPETRPLPAFAEAMTFSELERVFLLNEAIVYARHEDEDLLAHILVIDMGNPAVRVSAGLAATPAGRAGLVSELAEASGAFAAINADFWTLNLIPQNLMVIEGDVIAAPTNRATFGVTRDGEPVIAQFVDEWTWNASVTAADGGSIPLQLMNTGCEEAWICLYTDIYDAMPFANGYDGLRVLLSPDYEVLLIEENLPLEIPDGHFVLRTGSGTQTAAWLRDHVEVGDTLSISLPTEPDWQDFETAVGGGPLLIADGEFWQDCDEELPEEERICENFDENFRRNQYGRSLQPRSAIGYTEDGTVILIMVSGQDAGGSDGITQRDLAAFFLRLNAVRAMEFDGGGSSSMWIYRNPVNLFGERGERFVSSALLVFYDE